MVVCPNPSCPKLNATAPSCWTRHRVCLTRTWPLFGTYIPFKSREMLTSHHRQTCLKSKAKKNMCQANWWGMCQATAIRHVVFLDIFLSNAARVFQSERERCFPSRWVHNSCNDQVAFWLRWSILSPKQLQQRPFLDLQLWKDWKLMHPNDYAHRIHPTFALTLSLLLEEWTHALLSVLPAPVQHVHANPQRSRLCRNAGVSHLNQWPLWDSPTFLSTGPQQVRSIHSVSFATLMSQKAWIWPKHSYRVLGHSWLLMLQCDRCQEWFFCEEQTLARVLASFTTWCGHSCNLVHMNPECRIEGIHLGINQRPRPLFDKQPPFAASSCILGQIPDGSNVATF